MGKEEFEGSHERVMRESTSQEDSGLVTSIKRSLIHEKLDLDTSKIHRKKSKTAVVIHNNEVSTKKCKSRLTVQEEPYASGGVVSGKRSLECLYTCGIFAESWPT